MKKDEFINKSYKAFKDFDKYCLNRKEQTTRDDISNLLKEGKKGIETMLDWCRDCFDYFINNEKYEDVYNEVYDVYDDLQWAYDDFEED